MHTLRILFTILFLTMGFFNLFAQSKKHDARGGQHIRRYEKREPVKSTELKSLSTSFYIAPLAYGSAFKGHYAIELLPADNERFTLSCNNETIMVGNEVADDIQNIIAKYKLMENNGVTDITAGLPPEYQPMHFKATYASGEDIAYCINNNPMNMWQIELFRYVREQMLSHGNRAFATPAEFPQIERITLKYSDGDGIVHWYDNIRHDDGQMLMRIVYEQKTNNEISDGTVAIPDEYYTGINTLVDSQNLHWEANHKQESKIDAASHRYVYLYANGKDSKYIFSAMFVDEELTERIKTALCSLREYMDKPFDNK